MIHEDLLRDCKYILTRLKNKDMSITERSIVEGVLTRLNQILTPIKSNETKILSIESNALAHINIEEKGMYE